MDGSQSSRAGALLLLGVARAGGALGAGEDLALGDDQDVAVGELLLQLTGQTVGRGEIKLLAAIFLYEIETTQ